jgi:hypothetical protein
LKISCAEHVFFATGYANYLQQALVDRPVVDHTVLVVDHIEQPSEN